MEKLSVDEVAFHPLSVIDRRGRLFCWEGELYRAIGSKRARLYQDLFDRGVIKTLIEQHLLIETEISSLELDGYELTLKHRSIPFVSYPHEWCDLMFKDAALLHIQFVIELDRYNLTSKDASSLNILFDRCNPIFVDFCSIVPADEILLWPGKTADKFRCMFIHPLYLMSQGYGRIARSFIRDNQYVRTGMLKSDIGVFYPNASTAFKWRRYAQNLLQFSRRNTPLLVRPVIKKMFDFFKHQSIQGRKPSRSEFLVSLKQEIETLKIPRKKVKSYHCHDNFFSSFSQQEAWTKKQKSIYNILSQLAPKSVLDVDSDRGWYAQLAARLGSQTIAFDSEESCVQKLYIDAQKNNLSIIPLLLDFTSPLFDLSNDYFDPAHKRLSCDLVLSLTLFQHLLLKRHLTLEKALNRLLKLSKRWLLVEFIPREDLAEFIPPQDRFSRERWQQSPWYTLDEFSDLLKAQFHQIAVFPSFPPSRKLVLCEQSPNHER